MRGGEGGSECPGRPALRSGQPAAPPTSAAAEPRGPGSGSITSGDGFSGRGDPGGMPGSVVCALDPLLGSSGGRVKVRVKFWAAGGICLPRQTDSPLAPLRPGNGSWAQTSRAGRGRVTDKEIEAERRSECPQELAMYTLSESWPAVLFGESPSNSYPYNAAKNKHSVLERMLEWESAISSMQILILTMGKQPL
uniref:Uncharacterized protein LOC110211545 isoform X2 n=1 Tax=Phascolarctos cinereus TaxID=38626 RepID=A0A6P5KNW2_PHACI|nr:uncharacterized protein LOC110211545 isoform X2 [Phascolarctos cinereus]